MARVIWAEPALNDLDAIADYIALDKPNAASKLVRKVFEVVEHLKRFPEMGRVPPELRGSLYRELVVPPCRIFYRPDGETVHILYVMRGERQFEAHILEERKKET